MMRSTIHAVAAAVMIVALAGNRGVAGEVRRQQPPPPTRAAAAGSVPDGQKAFTKYGCAQCHGLEGQGAPTSGPRIGPDPLQLPAFIKYVRAPRGQMPPYTAKIVSDQEVADIRAFLSARSRPAVQTLLPPE